MVNTLEASRAQNRDSRKGTIRVRYWWALLLGAVLHRVPFVLWPASEMGDLDRALLVFSYVLLIWALFHNLRWLGMRVLTIGALFNFVGIVANGGLMPVSPEAHQLAHETILDPSYLGRVFHGSVLLPLESTNLPVFTDILPVAHLGGVYSIGDVLIGAGIVLFLPFAARHTWRLMRPTEEGKPRTEVEHVRA